MTSEDGRRLYKARGPDGEVAWVDHDGLWRLQQEQAEQVRLERARRQRRMLLGLAVLVAVALVLVFLRLRAPQGEVVASAPAESPAASESVAAPAAPEVTAGQPAGVESAQPVGAEPVAQPAAEATPPSGGVPTAPYPESGPAAEQAASAASETTGRVAEAVRSWGDAWARRDTSAYLAAYADSFEAADGSSRPAWESLRRRRLTTPAWIRVEIEELEITLRDGGRAEARFLQSYSSPDYADVVRKRLELVEEGGGGWRIVSERAQAP